LFDVIYRHYRALKAVSKALVRDIKHLLQLKAIEIDGPPDRITIAVRLEWATEITETEFYREINKLPAAKTRLIP
jgi:hypothetical protein